MSNEFTYSLDSNMNRSIPYCSKNDKSIYLNLIKNFEGHYIPEVKAEYIKNYMLLNCDPAFSGEILFLIEDYNSLLSQSIQAIKTLLSELLRLNPNESLRYEKYPQSNIQRSLRISQPKGNQNQFDINFEDKLNNEHSLTPIKNSEDIQKDIQRLPQDDNILNIANQYNQNYIPDVSQTNNKIIPNDNSQINEENLINNEESQIPVKKPLREKILNLRDETISHKEKMNLMKKTNQILKSIDVTEENKEYFIQKYVDSNLRNNSSEGIINEKYKIFLNNLINYEYRSEELDKIMDDIKYMYKENKINRNKQNKSAVLNMGSNTEDLGFKKSLRYYEKNKGSKNNKPFVQYTSPYGKLFSKS